MVDVIIVNYNQPQELRACVESVWQQSHVNSIRVRNTGKPMVLADVITANGENVGYGAACNEQARQCRANYLLFLNADIVLPADGLACALAQMKTHQDAGLCGIAMHGQAVSMHFPTPLQLMARSVSGRRGYARRTQDTSGYTDWVLGAFLLVRRTAFEAVGGFDEGFFLYFEEVDLAMRMAAAGWRCLYCADAKALHLAGKSAAKPFSIAQYAKSRIRYAKKYFSPAETTMLKAVIALAEPWARLVQGAVAGARPLRHHALAPWKGIKS